MYSSAITDDAGSSQSPAPWRRWLWPLAGLAAILVFELTANLSLTAFAFCVRFGWRDFRAVWWIARRDPSRSRRRALGLFHVAAGALKVVAASGAVALALTVLLTTLAKPGGNNLDAATTTALTGGAGFLIALLFSFCGLIAASVSGRRIWIDRDLSRNFPLDYPPTQFRAENELISFMGILGFVTFLVVFTLLFTTVLLTLQWFQGWELLAAMLLSLAGGAAAGLGVALWIDFVSAASPEDCWPELRTIPRA